MGADGVIGAGEGAAGGMGAGVAGGDGARVLRTRRNSLPMSNALSDDVIVERSLTKTLGEKTSTVAEHSAEQSQDQNL